MLKTTTAALGMIVGFAVLPTIAAADAHTDLSSDGVNGLVVTVTGLKRTTVGLELRAMLENTSDEEIDSNGLLTGREIGTLDDRFNSTAVYGLSLVDAEAQLRASPLFTAEGACLCTADLDDIAPGGTAPIYAIFPDAETDSMVFNLLIPAANPINDIPLDDG